MTKKWNMIVDIEGCNNCRGCFLAVKDEHTGNDFPGYAAEQPAMGANWLDIERQERGAYPIVDAHFMPVMCNHCDDAPCIKAAKNDAVKKRADGIVIIDPVKAKGQKEIVDACPYGAVSWNEELQLPQAWIFDAHLLDTGWEKTRCEQMCPTDVFKSVKVEDSEMQRIAKEEGLEVLQPELGTKPRIYYKNLHLMTGCFVGGTITTDIEGVEECAEGAQVILLQNGHEIARATTDTFGEFKIDGLKQSSGSYTVEVSLSASKGSSEGVSGSASKQFDLGEESPYLGVIKLTAAA
ncbi:MAG: oxidoreductase [Gammaproteobacteria bacterium]|nr:oxidoreductase [Gammaproteobacteria bacterium]